jgi:type I restriction enzyme S subunit
MSPGRLIKYYDRVSDLPDATGRLRRFILDLAVRGKLAKQDPNDEPGLELLRRIAAKMAQLAIADGMKPISTEPLQASEIPFDLPVGWVWSRIGEACSKTGSGSTPRGGKTVYKNEGVPFLRSQNIYDDGLRLEDVAYIDQETHRKMSGTAIRPKDLLLNITGGSIGRCCLVPDDFKDGNVSQHVAIIRPTISGIEEFFHLLIRSPYFQRFIIGEQTGAGRGGLPKNRMDRIPLALPPLAEQRRIVAKVGELMCLCDRLEAARAAREATRDRLTAASLARLNAPDPATFPGDAGFALGVLPALTTRPDQIGQLRQTILNLAIRGHLVHQNPSEEPAPIPVSACEPPPLGFPATWRYTKLSSLLAEDTRNGYSRKPDDAVDGTPILRISAATVRRDGVVAEEEHKLISGIDAADRLQFGLKRGDLLACRFNGNKAFVGRLATFVDYLGIQPIYPDKLIRVRIDPNLAASAFVRNAGDSIMVRSEIENLCATTVGNWGISATNLKQIHMPVPPLAEQHRIIAKVDELLVLCDQLEKSLLRADSTRARLLDALLHDALTPKDSDVQRELTRVAAC